MTRKKSRLYQRSLSQTKNNLILSIVGILVVLFLLIKFGIPILVNFSLFMGGFDKTAPITNNNSQVSFIDPPTLDSLPSATNSATLIVSGKTYPKTTVSIYLNESIADKINSDKDGKFSSTQTLLKGTNSINAKIEKDGKSSGFSEISEVLFKDTAPALNLNSPSDGQNFTKDQNTVNVSGSTDASVKITVNDFWAITDENNNFSYKLPLQSGENKIKIVATDAAGNKTEKDIKVNYSQ